MNYDTDYIGDATITLVIEGPALDMPHKSIINYAILLPSGRTYIDADLQVLTRETEAETLRTAYGALLSFLSAAAESAGYPDSENADLFPAHVTEWAAQYSDEIAMAAIELEELNADSDY